MQNTRGETLHNTIDINDINNIGMTAFFIAYFRDAEGKRGDALFEDPYSGSFVPDEVKTYAQRFAELCPEFETLIRCRFLVFRDLVRREIDRGVKQVVSVGAGFEMCPAIFETEGVVFYDVDQPEIVEYKRQVLVREGLEPWPAISCNYLEVNLPERLQDAGFDPSLPSLFVWEGNTMYLSQELVFGFLNQLAEHLPSFSIGFDYMSTKIINRSSGVDSVTRTFDYFWEQFTPFTTGFDAPSVFERNTSLKLVEAGGMEAAFRLRAPQYAESLAPLADLYNYCILSKGR